MTANVTSRPYKAEDFLRIRDFLSQSYLRWGRPFNWLIERWNYARYFVTPMIATWGDSDTEADAQDARDAIALWESWVRVWEDDGEIVAVSLSEDQRPGMGFTLQTPGYEHLLPEMVEHIETHMAKEDGSVGVFCNGVDWPLTQVLKERGYQINLDWVDVISMFEMRELPPQNLPAGYTLLSCADENDIDWRRECFGRAFNHPDPHDWPSALSYRALQSAPDYRLDQDLYIKGPDGTYVSGCIVWFDPSINVATLEPVGTHPDYRRKGFGREVVWEAIRRVGKLGATRVYVGSHQQFYLDIGFKRMHVGHIWERKTATK